MLSCKNITKTSFKIIMLKNNIIIGGLLAIVFLMIVGYVASASNLSITSTASTTKDI